MSTRQLDVSTARGFVEAVAGHGVTLAHLHGIADDELEAVYALSCSDLREGRTAQAAEQLAQLVEFAPGDKRFLVAYATALHRMCQYELAAKFFGYAMLMEATDALCALRIGECLAAQSQWLEARDAFEAAVKLSWLDPKYEAVRAAAQVRLDQLVALGV